MENPKLIVFSGKMGCGKDTAINHLAEIIPVVRAECKESLHNTTMSLFGVPDSIYWEVYNDRRRKDTPNTLFSITNQEAKRLEEELGGLVYTGIPSWEGMHPLTLREAMIYTSELVMKPMFGDDVFGKRRALKLEGNHVFFDGSFGFTYELTPAIEKLGQDNILGVRVLGRDDGKADSRGILPDGLLNNTVDIWNGEDISEDMYLWRVERVVFEWLGLETDYEEK